MFKSPPCWVNTVAGLYFATTRSTINTTSSNGTVSKRLSGRLGKFDFFHAENFRRLQAALLQRAQCFRIGVLAAGVARSDSFAKNGDDHATAFSREAGNGAAAAKHFVIGMSRQNECGHTLSGIWSFFKIARLSGPQLNSRSGAAMHGSKPGYTCAYAGCR